MRRLLKISLQAVAVLAVLFVTSPLRAVEPDEMLSNPVLEARARALSQELRCMVCQNESIDESHAPLAHDLRVLVRERLQAGDSDAQVLNFLVARYGEFVLLKPRLSWHTAALWGLPPGLLLVGIVMLIVAAKRRSAAAASGPAASLTGAEEARVAELLRSEGAP
ncbi:MAG: cytochrome c-type biogenesis protein [Xanthobacteraceae bacterium]|jgi:cytochrome c-type biogenesis protein CcmH